MTQRLPRFGRRSPYFEDRVGMAFSVWRRFRARAGWANGAAVQTLPKRFQETSRAQAASLSEVFPRYRNATATACNARPPSTWLRRKEGRVVMRVAPPSGPKPTAKQLMRETRASLFPLSSPSSPIRALSIRKCFKIKRRPQKVCTTDPFGGTLSSGGTYVRKLPDQTLESAKSG
jgi:hypothetical protein